MASISAVILAKNEESHIAQCIKSVRFCDEIIIINDDSIDQTVRIARKLGTKVIDHPLGNNFAAQRNFGLQKAKGEWVLFVDADEIVSSDLQKEIKKALATENFDGFFIKRIDTWLGKKLRGGEFGQVCLLRLGKRKKGRWIRAIHEHWGIDGQVGTLNYPLLHYPHQSVHSFIDHINFHGGLHANENAKEQKDVSIFVVLFYPLGKFLNNFIVKKGYKDGIHGFVAAMIMSFHSFLAWSILWTKKHSNQS